MVRTACVPRPSPPVLSRGTLVGVCSPCVHAAGKGVIFYLAEQWLPIRPPSHRVACPVEEVTETQLGIQTAAKDAGVSHIPDYSSAFVECSPRPLLCPSACDLSDCLPEVGACLSLDHFFLGPSHRTGVLSL